MKKINVCVFPAQNECAVEINNALSICEGIEVFGLTSIRGHNEYNFKNYKYDIDDIDSELFIDEFNCFCKEKKIDIVFPTCDFAVEFFAKNKNKINALVTTPSFESAMICNDKRKTYSLFEKDGFCPKIYRKIEKYPCFIKPNDGEGSKGVKLIQSIGDIPNGIDLNKYIISEFLPGKEITVDCLTDKNGKLVLCLPRIREKIFSGMCVQGQTINSTIEIEKIASIINSKLSFRGLWFFQLKESFDGSLKLLEVSMRCAGTMCLTRARGFNLPLLTVYTILGKEVDFINNSMEVKLDRTLFARYNSSVSYNTVYVDYDGTIIIKEKVCLSVIRFLFQCKNAGKKIVLISRHNEDHNDSLYENMKKYGISTFLFDEIYSISFEDEKYSYISDKNSIFIDNSFLERKKVFNNVSVPVFGVDGLDALQDWRL